MDQQESNLPEIQDSLRIIFENSEIYYTLQRVTQHQNTPNAFGGPSMQYLGPDRVILNLKVKQRENDFNSGKKTWDETVFMELLGGKGVFVKKNQSFNSQSADMVIDYTFHITDYKSLQVALAKYSEELFNKQFTVALEDKLSED